ncbi:helix-turn-helix domain-containing protein [Butyricicoccus sp.]|uniref:helix-turn-helix domain-containing protein n=1 Tax=Butyricicoccus sp. TaxID=2049021 RepID=UPI003D7E2FA9
MASDFSRTLALLRREKRISQRTAAGDLQVSQALLSHYENGLREPGLSFVVRAADYYGVSCDYLLGRSLSREGGMAANPVPANAEEVEVDAELARKQKLITDSAQILLDAAAKSGSRQLLNELTMYLSAVEYKLFRYLYAADDANPEEAFRTKEARFDALCDARMKLTELRIQCAAQGGGALGLEEEEAKLPSLSLANLPTAYPEYAESLLQVLQNVSDSIEEFDCTTKKKK